MHQVRRLINSRGSGSITVKDAVKLQQSTPLMRQISQPSFALQPGVALTQLLEHDHCSQSLSKLSLEERLWAGLPVQPPQGDGPKGQCVFCGNQSLKLYAHIWHCEKRFYRAKRLEYSQHTAPVSNVMQLQAETFNPSPRMASKR